MKIKLLQTIMLMGSSAALPRGSVVESDDPAAIAEYKALLAVGYAAETSEKVSTVQYLPGGNTPPISGIKPKEVAVDGDDAEVDDAELEAMLEGNADSVLEELDGLNAAALKRMGELEAAGKGRKGVGEAIDAAIAAIDSE